jgi:hypothetical protein
MLTGPIASSFCFRPRQASSSSLSASAFQAGHIFLAAQFGGFDAQVADTGGFHVFELHGQLRGVCAAGAARLAEAIHLRAESLQVVLQLLQLLAQQLGLFGGLRRFFEGASAHFRQALALHRELFVLARALLFFRGCRGQLLLQLVDPPFQVAVHAIDAGEGRFRAAAALFQSCQQRGDFRCLLLRLLPLAAQLLHALLQFVDLDLSRGMLRFQARNLFALLFDQGLANAAQIFVALALHDPVIQPPLQPGHFRVHLAQRRALVGALPLRVAPLFADALRLGRQLAQ